jgi:hypothetical protein
VAADAAEKRYRSRSLFSSRSYKCLVSNTIITPPDQSAMALPKNDPMCVFGSETVYGTIHETDMPIAALKM